MQKLMIRFSIISILLLVFASCAVKAVKDFDKTEVTSQVYKSPYFSDKNEDYVYKASISVYGNNFGGIFIVKRRMKPRIVPFLLQNSEIHYSILRFQEMILK